MINLRKRCEVFPMVFQDFAKYSITQKENRICFGALGVGKVFHPWDELEYCFCGGYPWMVGKDEKEFYSGLPYKIICLKCRRETSLAHSLDEVSNIKKEWNDKSKEVGNELI